MASYTRIHFEGRNKDVFTVHTANQRHVCNMLELPYEYKEASFNQKTKTEKQTKVEFHAKQPTDDGINTDSTQ